MSTTVAAKILALKFIEMSEISSEDLNPSAPTGRPRLAISDISVWVEKFATMAAILAQRFPEKAPELFAYLALIVRCERNYQPAQWVAYDRAFRREALALPDLNWSIPNPRLFQEAFTGRARDIPRCHLCLRDDHVATSCPLSPQSAPPSTGYHPPPPPPNPLPSQWGRATQPPHRQSQELCYRWNRGLCKVADNRCRYTHACRECRGNHRAHSLPPHQPPGRSRQVSWSPLVPRSTPLPGPQFPSILAPAGEELTCCRLLSITCFTSTS